MAAIIDYQRVTHQEVIVKISGADAESATIDLDVDLFSMSETLAGVGTIVTTDSDQTVTGATAGFNANMIGAKLYRPDDKTFLGTIATITSPTEVELVANAVTTWSGNFGIAHRSDEIVGVQTVPIVSVVFTGTGVATVTRNAVDTMVLNAAAGATPIFDLAPLMGPDKQEEKNDITVAFGDATGGSTQVWLKLRKVDGWKTRIEQAQYGAHDDPTKVGSLED